ncbi:phage antirepressor Ant [Citrobacter sp. RHBSTW-00903]|uniref:phage antirepressor N-terminal domain-containing protein n=1 Tax=Citrobacter sp. RHBSTW-00903 TaxID=2742670 RepID=UPI0015EA6334|nr:phage antirepressor N-terminal domain-containing protein [Citrobacter sp. RHBSTW-00903]QLS34872.1 phage antirepressor Ant [Citrobacter sp. RHBSTW-00903]
MTSIAILEAVNTSYVPFGGQQVLTAMAAGIAYVAMKPIVENLGMSWGTQQQKLARHMNKFGCIHMNIPSAGGIQEMLVLPLKKLNGWLFSINPEKVRADIRDKLIQYQEECFTVLHDYWTKGQAINPRKTSTDERTPLRDAINMLVGKRGIMYPEAYSYVHQRFNVGHIDELPAQQLPVVIEYVHRLALEGEFLGKQEVLPAPIAKQFTDDELCSLAYLWRSAAVMYEACREVHPLLVVAEHRLSPRFCSIGTNYSRGINKAREILKRETNHIKEQPWGDSNWKNTLTYDMKDF